MPKRNNHNASRKPTAMHKGFPIFVIGRSTGPTGRRVVWSSALEGEEWRGAWSTRRDALSDAAERIDLALS